MKKETQDFLEGFGIPFVVYLFNFVYVFAGLLAVALAIFFIVLGVVKKKNWMWWGGVAFLILLVLYIVTFLAVVRSVFY